MAIYFESGYHYSHKYTESESEAPSNSLASQMKQPLTRIGRMLRHIHVLTVRPIKHCPREKKTNNNGSLMIQKQTNTI